MKIWMALDPETLRVTMQPTEFSDGDFPRGLRGQGWPIREGSVDPDSWGTLLAGSLSPAEQDRLHRETWNDSGAAAWPMS